MRKKQKVALSKYGVGVDMGKKNFQGCIKSEQLDGQTKVVATKKFDNTPSGHQAFYDWLTKHRKNKDIPCQILIEVTGVYHENLLYYLYDKGLEVCVEMPKKVKRFLQSIGQYSKTDKLDSKGLAEMACERRLKKWKPLSKDIRELRTLLRHRKSLIKSKIQFQNQLHAINHSSLIGKEVKQSLKRSIEALGSQIKRIEKSILKMAEKNKEVYEKINMIVDSLPGLGMISMLTIIAETNGFSEIKSMKQLESYAGYDVIENSSGMHKGKTKISKRGNVHLRTSTYMPTVTIIGQKLQPFYPLYCRIVKRSGGIKKKAMVAVQRKLLVLVYTLWNKNEKFNPNYEWNRDKENQEKLIANQK